MKELTKFRDRSLENKNTFEMFVLKNQRYVASRFQKKAIAVRLSF